MSNDFKNNPSVQTAQVEDNDNKKLKEEDSEKRIAQLEKDNKDMKEAQNLL